MFRLLSWLGWQNVQLYRFPSGGTWQHKFSDAVHTKTESYIMWQENGVVSGTPSAGPLRPFGGGGGIGPNLPGTSWAYGILNYTMFILFASSLNSEPFECSDLSPSEV